MPYIRQLCGTQLAMFTIVCLFKHAHHVCNANTDMGTEDMKSTQRLDEAGAYIQQVICALLAVGLQGVAPDGLCHLLGPEHAANTQHHLVQHQNTETKEEGKRQDHTFWGPSNEKPGNILSYSNTDTKHCSNIIPRRDAVADAQHHLVQHQQIETKPCSKHHTQTRCSSRLEDVSGAWLHGSALGYTKFSRSTLPAQLLSSILCR